MAYNFPEEELKVLQFWEENNIFKKTLEKTKDKKPFVFYDGPPFATGTPHYGHLLQSVIKDVVPRYKTMQGFYVARQWGWDCHGLPIENIVEKELGTKSKKDVAVIGVKKFNDLCRERIFTFIEEWERVIPRFGRWADMQHPYKTMDFEYMQSEWWAFKELYDKGLIYEDYRSMHICPRCETTLSQGEVAEGYKDVKDLSVTVKFKVKNPEKIGLSGNVYFLAWTTTPWTLPGNVALAIGEKIHYYVVEIEGVNYILAQEKIKDVLVDKNYTAVKELLGKDLVGMEYQPLFDYYSKDQNLKNCENGWKVYAADFVTTEKGTGIAHEAPAFGAEDWTLLKQENLPFVQHVKMDGTFKPEVLDFALQDLKPRAKNKPEEIREADLTVVKFLEEKGLVFGYEKYEHPYPHCWRCDTALLNYATSSWFVAVEKIKPILLKTAKKINWAPDHIKEGRFGQWLENARDWSISRQRFWANTIPVWRCGKCSKQKVFAAASELKKASGILVSDLHKDVVDEVKFSCNCGGEMKRVSDVLDTWFDSGSVGFATKRPIPADFIGEAQDQTRAWFYYQHVLVGALFGKAAFKNAIATGFIWAEDGKKMSKKLKNYPDPMEVMNRYGADAMRFYILSSPVVQGENLSFSEKGVDEIMKKNLGRLQNVLAFYQLYATTPKAGESPMGEPRFGGPRPELGRENGTQGNDKSKNILDQWILMRLQEVLTVSTKGYENYQLDEAARPLTDFIDDLSVWYLRRSRDRFKEENEDKKNALATLRYVLFELSKIMAPVMPFFAEQLFRAVRENTDQESVHLESWPKIKIHNVRDLKEAMNWVRSIVALALAERSAKAIKVRQPLAKLKVKDEKFKAFGEQLLELIKEEINVKEIVFDKSIENAIELDVNLTDELKEEGVIRDIIRDAQEARKAAGLKPDQRADMEIMVSLQLKGVIEKNQELLKKEIRLDNLVVVDQANFELPYTITIVPTK